MILSCPACKTRYVVPDSAIGVAGRQVRCAACRHSWFQQGHEVKERELVGAGAATSTAAAPPPAQRTFPIAREEAPTVAPRQDPPPVPVPPPAYVEAAADPYDEDPDFRPRRNPAKMWTMVAIAAAALMLSAVAALYFLLPQGSLQTAGAAPATPLVLEVTRKPERRPLESGNELLAVSGRVVNPTAQTLKVPPIKAELRDAQGRIVYDWEISAPVTELAANGSASFNSAEVDVPRGARRLSLSFAPAAF